MSVNLDTDRIKTCCQKRRRWFLALTCIGAAMIPVNLCAHPAPGHISLARPGAFLLIIAATLLGDLIWRCPACNARLPRAWEFPHYCPRCAVPLSNPSEAPGDAMNAVKLACAALLSAVVIVTMIAVAVGPPQRHQALGRGSGQAAIARPTEADIAALKHQMLLANYLLGQRFPGVRLHGTNADLALLQRLLDDRRPGADRGAMLRCIGAAFGNVLSQDPDFGWVILDDGAGPEFGLQSRSASRVVFSMEMIARRTQNGETVDLRKLYANIHAEVDQRGGSPV
jgi:hypothetical protein